MPRQEFDGYEFLEDADAMLQEEFIHEYNLTNGIEVKWKRDIVKAHLYFNALKYTRPKTWQMLMLLEAKYDFIQKLKEAE